MPGTPPPRKALRQRIRRLLKPAASVLGAAFVGTLGWVLAKSSASMGTPGLRERPRFGWLCAAAGEALARLSYDLPFLIRGAVDAPDACIVYLDEGSATVLGQHDTVWDRRLHTQLLRRLEADKPRAVFFDIVFKDSSSDPGVDRDFADAIRKNGHVFLAAGSESNAGASLAGGSRVRSTQVLPPPAILRKAAAGWGHITFDPLDADFGVRRIPAGTDTVPFAMWRMAKQLGAPLTDTPEARAAPRWMNYYGDAGKFPSLPYDRALNPDDSPGFFRDRVVFVGGRSTLSGLDLGKDDFRTPYGLLGDAFSSGVEVHLTAFENLLHGEWLTRLDENREPWLILATGIVLGGMLPRFRPHIAALLALAAFAGIAALALWMFGQRQMWFAWCVPAFVQTPVALVWAVGARYFLEERRRRALRQAFGHYISPHIADRIAESDFDLEPGGTVTEVSVIFTDLEGFTPLSEELSQPELITQVLVKYFTQTTAPILENDGTIINFVGDAVTAVWGAPLAEPDHARKAALAACRLHESARIEVDGRVLRTRVGLHTGRVLTGNIGSAERFDYAVVGDPVNFASRLEGLNKRLGTNVLISDAIRQKLGDEFSVRRVGEFRVVGKRDTCVVHELLGLASAGPRAPWCESFENGVAAFCSGDLDAAARAMRETIELHGGIDGPAQFYLAQIETLRRNALPADWNGVINFTEK